MKNMNIKKNAAICLSLCFSVVTSGMDAQDAESEFKRLKSYCNRAAEYSDADKFEKSLELLDHYSNAIFAVKSRSAQIFQCKAIRTSIENLSEALEIAEASVSSVEDEETKLEVVSALEENADYETAILKLKNVIFSLNGSKEHIKNFVFDSIDSGKKIAFFDCILRGIDAIRGIGFLIEPGVETQN
jgi:tetratricopeptide (TPR) repeat protein